MVLRYLLFCFFLCCVNQVAHAKYQYWTSKSQARFDDAGAACTASAPSGGTSTPVLNPNAVLPLVGKCDHKAHNGADAIDSSLFREGTLDCPAQGEDMGLMGFTFNGTAPDDWLPPAVVCGADECEYDFAVGSIALLTSNQTRVTGDATSRGIPCDDPTDGDEIPYECKQQVCDVPPETDCPATHTKGTFNGKTICVMNPDEATCTPTILDPYKCIPKPDEPTPPDAGGNCPAGKVQVRTPTGIKCMTENTPPDPNNNCPTDYISQTVNGTTTCTPNNQVPRGPGGGTCPVGTTLNTAENGDKTCKKSDSAGDGEGDEDDTGEGGQSCNDAFFKKFCEAIDWLRKDAPLPKNPTTTINDMTLPSIDTNKLNWHAQCPASKSLTLGFGAVSTSFEFEFDMICDAFNKAAPWVRAFAWLSACYILIGAVRK